MPPPPNLKPLSYTHSSAPCFSLVSSSTVNQILRSCTFCSSYSPSSACSRISFPATFCRLFIAFRAFAFPMLGSAIERPSSTMCLWNCASDSLDQLTNAPLAFSTIFALLLASMNKSSHSSTSCGPISFLPLTFASMFAGVSS